MNALCLCTAALCTHALSWRPASTGGTSFATLITFTTLTLNCYFLSSFTPYHFLMKLIFSLYFSILFFSFFLSFLFSFFCSVLFVLFFLSFFLLFLSFSFPSILFFCHSLFSFFPAFFIFSFVSIHPFFCSVVRPPHPWVRCNTGTLTVLLLSSVAFLSSLLFVSLCGVCTVGQCGHLCVTAVSFLQGCRAFQSTQKDARKGKGQEQEAQIQCWHCVHSQHYSGHSGISETLLTTY